MTTTILTYALFAVLSWFAFNMYYTIQIVDKKKIREDALLLLMIAAIQVGGIPLLTFTIFCNYLLFVREMRLYKRKIRFGHIVLMITQTLVVYGALELMQSFFPSETPLVIMLTTFGTIFLTQVYNVILNATMFQLPVRGSWWMLEMVRFNLMDSLYLSLYFISAAYTRQMESSFWRLVITLAVLIGGILGLYYWRTVGIRQTQIVKEQVRELKSLNTQLTMANQQVLLAFASSLEKRDPYTAGHSERVAHYAMAIARELGMSDADIELIQLGGLLHDIGKIGIPDYVLNKPDRLTDEEYEIMKKHPVLGEELLREVFAFSNAMTGEERQRMLEIVLYHHERPDGRGYPRGLIGDEIPLFARLTAVADAYDAMTSNRAYRTAMSVEKAIRILLEGRGTQFWEPAVDAFLRTAEHRLPEQHLAEVEAAPAAEDSPKPLAQ